VKRINAAGVGLNQDLSQLTAFHAVLKTVDPQPELLRNFAMTAKSSHVRGLNNLTKDTVQNIEQVLLKTSNQLRRPGLLTSLQMRL